MEFKGVYAKGTDARDLMKTAHYAFGLSIFMLFWLRVLARSMLQTLGHTATTSLWQLKLVAVTHAALYLLMLLQPILGCLLINAQQSSTMIFGFALPQLLTPDVGERLEELHEITATAGYVLIGFHSAAALIHHYYLKDATLHKMLFSIK